MRPYHIHRLERLAHILDRVHETMDGRFNLGHFLSGNDPFQGRNIAGVDFEDPESYQHTCGTTACALGWAGCDPQFRRAGFRTRQSDPPYSGGHVEFHDRKGHVVACDFGAAGRFFGIGYERAVELFGVDYVKRVYHKVSVNDVTAHDVALAVRRLVKQLKRDNPKLAVA